MAERTHLSGRADVTLWACLAAALGAANAFALLTGHTLALAATVGVPALWWLCDRPEWVPSVLALGLLAEAATFGGLSISRMLVPVALLALAFSWLRGTLPRLDSKKFVFLIAAYVCLAFASIGWTTDPSLSLGRPGTAYNLAALLIAIVNFATFSLLVQTSHDLVRLFTVISLAAVLLALIGFTQAFLGVPPLGAADQTAAELGPRSTGLAADPNFFAAYQLLAALMMLILAPRTSGLTRAGLFIGLAVVVVSIYTSGSRGGQIAAAVALAFIFGRAVCGARWSRQLKSLTLLAAALAAIGGTSYYFAHSHSVTSERGGASDRTNLWAAAIHAIEQHPVLGIGYGAFQPNSNALLLATPGVDFTDFKLLSKGAPVHNAYLESETELGPLGLLIFVGLIVTAVWKLICAAQRSSSLDDFFLNDAAALCAIGLISFATASIFLSTESNRALWLMFGLAVALSRITLELDDQNAA